MKKTKEKYDPLIKIKVIEEYFKGASAKEIYKKYNVKPRTTYEWSKKAKEGTLFTKAERKSIDFLIKTHNNVQLDNKEITNNYDNKDNSGETNTNNEIAYLIHLIKTLEDRVRVLEDKI